MLADIKAVSDKLSVTDAEKLVVAVLFTHQFGVVEQREHIPTRFQVGAEIEETSFLVDVLGVVNERVTRPKDEVVGVLIFFPLISFGIKEGLENRVDIADFYAVEIDRRKRLAKEIGAFPIVAERGT